MRTRRLSLAITLTCAVALAGCGAVGEELAERAIEEAVEAGASAGEVDIEFDEEGGGISVESSEGSFQVGSQELPEDFPADFPIPDGAEVVTSMSFNEGDQTNQSVIMTVPGADADALASDVVAQLEGSGYEKTGEFNQEAGDTQTHSATLEGNGLTVNIIVAGTPDEVTLNYTVQSATTE